MDTRSIIFLVTFWVFSAAFAAFAGYARGHCKGWLKGYGFRESMIPKRKRDKSGRYAPGKDRPDSNTAKLPLNEEV